MEGQNITIGSLVKVINNIGVDKNKTYKITSVDYNTKRARFTPIGGGYDDMFVGSLRDFVLIDNQQNLLIKNEGIKNIPTETKKVCEIIFTREKGEQLLYIKTTQEIADLFKSTDGVAISDNYLDKEGKKLKYQKETGKLDQYVLKYKKVAYSSSVILNRYGTNLVVDNCYNFSVLRTNKIENGITVKVGDLILEDDVSNWVQNLGSFLKFLHRNYIDKVEIKATISMEM